MLSRFPLLTAVLLGVAAGADAQPTRTCAVQGSAPTPAALGARVTVAGVVTSAYRTASGPGFFLQDPNCDGDAATSDALWVDARAIASLPPVGNRATVSGRVADDGGLTTVVLESVSDEGRYAGSLEAVRLSPPLDPAAAAAYFESHEGMLVSLGASRVVAATDATGVAYVMPEASGVLRLFRTDADGRKLGLTAPEGWLALNHGDRVLDASGALVEAPGGFRVWIRASRGPSVEPGRATPSPAAAAPAGVLSVATYNLDTLSGVADGAVAPIGLALRAQSIARGLASPDVLAVQEVASLGTLQDLAAQPELVGAGYRAALVEDASPGPHVGLLYRADHVALRSLEARPASGLAGRAPLVARIETIPGGERLTLIACDFQTTASGPDAAAVRAALADHVRALAEEARLADPDSGLVVLGDLADVEDSAPLARLTAGLLHDPNARPAAERTYTAQAQGVSLTSDYVLVDAALAGRVTEARAVHVNVDWAHPAPGSAAGASPRVSDHDPVLVRVRPR